MAAHLSDAPRIETERLILRAPSLDDLDRWAEMMAHDEAAKFIGGVVPKPVAWRIIMQVAGAWRVTGVSMFSVVDKARGVWIGRVGPWHPYGWPGDEVGWGLHPDAWGQGFALEAAVAAMDFAFDVLDWPHVIHCINPLNGRSRALAQRLGSRLEREAPMPPPYDHETVEVWGQTRHAWRATRASMAAPSGPTAPP